MEEDIAFGNSPGPSGMSSPHVSVVPLGPSPLDYPPLSRFRPEMLSDDSLATENVHLGPLTERLTASLANDALPKLAGAIVNTGDASGAGTSASMDSLELEERVRRELNYLGIFPWDAPGPSSAIVGGLSSATKSSMVPHSAGGGNSRNAEIDWSNRTDDEISASLRACQRRLRDQMTVNEGRKAKLSEIVRDRLAFQEYESLRDALEKQIETGWIRRQRHGKRKTTKGRDREKVTEAARQPLPENLVSALEKRRRLVDGLSPLFRDAEQGRFCHIPTATVYGSNPLTTVAAPSANLISIDSEASQMATSLSKDL